MFAPANNIFQAENTDLSTGMTLVAASVKNVHNLRTEEKIGDIWDEVVTQIDTHSRRTRRGRSNSLLQDFVVEETTEKNEMHKDKMRRLFYNTFDQVINEIDVRFRGQNTKLHAAVSAFQPKNSKCLDVKMVQPLLYLLKRTSVEAEFDVAKAYIAKFNGNEKTKPTTTKLLSDRYEALKSNAYYTSCTEVWNNSRSLFRKV